MDYVSAFAKALQALRVLGKRLVVAVEKAA